MRAQIDFFHSMASQFQESVGKILQLWESQTTETTPPDANTSSVWERLCGAYCLRGSCVLLAPRLLVRFDALPELGSLVVMIPNTTRKWGALEDLVQLSYRALDFFGEGIIILDQSTCTCQWIRGHYVVKLEAMQSLRRLAIDKYYLVLARTMCDDGAYVFSHVQAIMKNKKHRKLLAATWIRFFLMERAMIVAAPCAFSPRSERSLASEDATAGSCDAAPW